MSTTRCCICGAPATTIAVIYADDECFALHSDCQDLCIRCSAAWVQYCFAHDRTPIVRLLASGLLAARSDATAPSDVKI